MVYRKYILDRVSCFGKPYLWVFLDYRQWMELRFLKEATSSIQVVVTELSGFGTAILVNVINLGGEVGSVCSEGPWVFVGMPNVVKVSFKLINFLFQFCGCPLFFALVSSRCELDLTCWWWLQVWNTESGAEYSLKGLVGQVNALTAVKDLLFAGIEVNYFANSLEFFCSLTIVKAICFYLFKEKNPCWCLGSH